MDLPFTSHPLYNFRKAIIIFAIVGIILCFAALEPWGSEAFQVETFLLVASIALSAADVYHYAQYKKDYPDQDPPWPVRKCMLGDTVLTVVLLLGFAAALVTAASGWNYRQSDAIVPAYAALGALLCSALHAYCLWKQVVARPDIDSAMEEGLLIGSDFGTGYGSISTPEPEPSHEPTLEQPVEVVVGSSSRSKGKKKVAGERKQDPMDF
ncbi:hypothetical protein B0A55_10873 [Friedmanniomyces simplex]|uniref:MARVEL domain-containing protein n=1 Tax=Friedmanniomyces simplex TaxID=329884 RepID=A0A4U0WR44_9PEZI|nr:hypothetical protein B0A55_10873 [Friedmanniomyces simplex]